LEREKLMKRSRALWTACAVVVGGIGSASAVLAAPYASNVSVSGTTVNFILNENADSLTYSINGGPPQPLTPTKGAQTFSLTSASDKFSIQVAKNDPVGYSIPTGGTIASSANGLSQTTNAGGFRLISDDSNVLNRFNSPRGVTVNTNPNSPNFGTSYIANSAAGSTTGVVRAVGDGLYAVHADQSDAFGYGNTAQSGIAAWSGTTASTSAPFRVSVGPDNNVYIADFSDTSGTVWRMSNTLGNPTQVLATVGGPSTVPAGQNHGSSTAVYVEGNSANGNLKVYTLDEDLTGTQFGQAGTADKNNLWRYDVGTDAAMPYNGTPTRLNANPVLLTAATSDLDRGLVDGKWYLAQNRAAGAEAGVVVLNPDGTTAYDSLTASRALLGNPTASDILRNILGMDVSDDQRWLALMLNNSDVAVVPLINGLPDLANRLLIDTGTDVNSGRDIAFDAADNIHYVSSGQALYRVLSPGGQTLATTSFDGNGYSFTFAVPEPTSIAFAGLAAGAALLRRRRHSTC